MVLAQVQMPLMVLPILTVMLKIDANLSDASRVLGAGEWKTLWRITIPLSLPGVIAGCILTYTACITAFVTQTLIGGARLIYMPLHILERSAPTTGRSPRRFPWCSAVAVLVIVGILGALGRELKTYARPWAIATLDMRSSWRPIAPRCVRRADDLRRDLPERADDHRPDHIADRVGIAEVSAAGTVVALVLRAARRRPDAARGLERPWSSRGRRWCWLSPGTARRRSPAARPCTW